MIVAYEQTRLDDGGFMASCPTMKPVIVQAKTEKELETKLRSVIKLYMSSPLRKAEEPREFKTIKV